MFVLLLCAAELLSDRSVFTPQGWENIAQGEAPGNRCPTPTQPEGLRQRVSQPYRLEGLITPPTRGVAPGYVVPPLRGENQDGRDPRHPGPFGHPLLASAQPNT